ncbi:hypothetical protein [Mycobacterium sp. E2479]|uniref:hypothetical protein n=1 Tax=Mycobacterium sp. E2479 TaxID=1834134 RepID=UPI0012E9A3CD|nr:hypothetical protein [Mycobacterium sp. E2479]
MMEFTTGMLISRSYIQGKFAVMIETAHLLGYDTDMPLYVMAGFYPVIIFLGFKLIEAFGIQSILARSVSAGVVMLLIDAPYVVNGPLPQVNWWVWLDWTIGGRHIFQYWYGWPMADAFWELIFPSLMMFMVWQWETRRDVKADPEAVKSTPWKTLLATPVVLGVLMNTLGPLLSFPMGIFIALNLPHYPLVISIALAWATVMWYSAKTPTGLDRAGWTLLGVHVVGYGAVTLANFTYRPVPSGQITVCLIALTTIVILAAWPGCRTLPEPGARSRGGVGSKRELRGF